MRRGELCGLRWTDLDGTRLTVGRSRTAVGYDVVEREPKSGRTRTVILDDATVAELRAHRTQQLEERLAWGEAWTDTGYVFVRENGEPIHPHSMSQFFETWSRRPAYHACHCTGHATPTRRSAWRQESPRG